jgi:hypothetical protein
VRRVGEAHAINRHLKTVSTLRLRLRRSQREAALNFDPSGLVANCSARLPHLLPELALESIPLRRRRECGRGRQVLRLYLKLNLARKGAGCPPTAFLFCCLVRGPLGLHVLATGRSPLFIAELGLPAPVSQLYKTGGGTGAIRFPLLFACHY